MGSAAGSRGRFDNGRFDNCDLITTTLQRLFACTGLSAAARAVDFPPFIFWTLKKYRKVKIRKYLLYFFLKFVFFVYFFVSFVFFVFFLYFLW